MTGSEVRYVNSGGVHIAYRVFGDGPVDLVLVPAFTSHLEQNHEWPGLVGWNQRLASFSRLIVFDKRSTGLSDHAPGPVVLEETMEDVLAVLDAARPSAQRSTATSRGAPWPRCSPPPIPNAHGP